MPIHYLLLPLTAAILFTLSTMLIKRAFEFGANSIPVFHHANYLGATLFSALMLLEAKPVAMHLLYQPAIVGATIFAGAWLTFAAIRKGDVSLVTPLLGTKVVVVAATSVVLTGRAISGAMWLAAALAALGIFALSFRDMKPGRRSVLLPTLALSLLSAATFGVSDVLLGMWAPGFGPLSFIALVFISVATLTVFHSLVLKSPLPRFPKPSRVWVWTSNLLLTTQALMMSLALAFFDDPTFVNIVYGSRGMWGIVLVWVLGSMLGMQESHHRPGTMLWRLAGATLITTAIVIAVLDQR